MAVRRGLRGTNDDFKNHLIYVLRSNISRRNYGLVGKYLGRLSAVHLQNSTHKYKLQKKLFSARMK